MTIDHKLRLNQIVDMYSSFPEPEIMTLHGDCGDTCIGWKADDGLHMYERLRVFNKLIKQVRELINDN